MRQKKVGLGLALLVLLLSAVLGATVLREPIAYAATPFQSVLVANTADNPVPVKLQGSADVTVNDDRERFQKRLDVHLDSGQFLRSGFVSVPAGKRLTVEYIAISATVPPDQGVSAFFQADNAGGAIPLYTTGLQKKSVGDLFDWAASERVLVFVEENDTFVLTLSRTSSVANGLPPGTAGMVATVSGYLEPMPS
jgi:hypothetical protein